MKKQIILSLILVSLIGCNRNPDHSGHRQWLIIGKQEDLRGKAYEVQVIYVNKSEGIFWIYTDNDIDFQIGDELNICKK